MKSLKKRFKHQLGITEQHAVTLALLTADIDLLSSAHASAEAAVNACAALQHKTAELAKDDFATAIAQETALLQLEEWVDSDVISTLENSCFNKLDMQGNATIEILLGQLLDKLDRQHALLVGAIQQLFDVLEAG